MRSLFSLLGLASVATCTNFDWEKVQLQPNETAAYHDIGFSNTSGPNSTYTGPKCKIGPGDEGWPTADEWAKFNATLGGVLLKPKPPAAVCYAGEGFNAATCNVVTSTNRSRYFINDPVSVLTDWTTGSTCVAVQNPNRTCTQGGFPTYVVNATTVRHIQLAINFARNRNLRLVVKNAGHDFGGRNSGAGALSIWTHHLKEFEYLGEQTVGSYKGRVARVSAGIEAWELYAPMAKYNITMIVPGGDTVGVFGGFIAGGGHNFLSSLYGNGADQILEFKVVTADGKYRTVTPYQNADLFFAMLGGGGSTYGVLTSALVKAWPYTPVQNIDLVFEYGTSSNLSLPANSTLAPAPVIVNTTDIFWAGVYLYQRFTPTIVNAGGTLYSYVRPLENGALNFSVIIKLPLVSPAEATKIVTPLYTDLNNAGIPVVARPVLNPESDLSLVRTGTWNPPGNILFASRFFPRTNWDNATIYNATFAAIRNSVEQGFVFHGVDHYAPPAVAGFPGNVTAINPVWRSSYMHADVFDYSFKGFASTDVETFWKGYAKLTKVMDWIREVTPTGGAYFNEGDVMEPNWQRTFYGTFYGRLERIKRARDPWGLFWAPTTPGSEVWKVDSVDKLPTQNGKLCRTGLVWEEEEEEEE